MTEVPEYLLQRSRERRAALGLPPSDGAPAEAPAAEAPTGAEPAPAPDATEAAGPPATVQTATAAAVPETEPPAEPEPTYLAPPPGSRSGIPVWMMPVLLLLPFWAIAYLGAFGTSAKPGAAAGPAGPALFVKNCSPCHGAKGEGGVGPKLAGGEAKLTFPNEPDHITWVETGSAPHKGQPYGDPNRAGGQHVAKSGGMPPFKGQLKDDEIKAIVEFERNNL